MTSIKKSVYQVIGRPRITEKSAMASTENNGMVFDVHPRANKLEIKHAIEAIFDVKVRAVRTLNCRGKIRRVGQRVGRRSDWKKAYVSLEQGQSIDIIEGL